MTPPPLTSELTTLGHVYWLGGGSGGGKSTIARRIADEFGMAFYDTDTTMATHADEASAADAPLIDQFKRMSMDERWLLRSPQEMLETFHWFNGEAFDLILRDLRAYPPGTRVIVEGLRLLPHLVAPHLVRRSQALWLLPTPDFRAAAFEARGTMWDIANRTSRPPEALQNLLDRDHLFTQRLEVEVRQLDLPLLIVDGQRSLDETTRLVTEMMQLR